MSLSGTVLCDPHILAQDESPRSRSHGEQLADTLSLQGATMPDGQKYEDWLKDKKAQGEDEKSE